METKCIAFLCLHNGIRDKSSYDVLILLNKFNLLNIIIPIEVNDETTRYLIKNNTRNITIQKLPAFIVNINDEPPLIYYVEDIDEVIQLANEITLNAV